MCGLCASNIMIYIYGNKYGLSEQLYCFCKYVYRTYIYLIGSHRICLDWTGVGVCVFVPVRSLMSIVGLVLYFEFREFRPPYVADRCLSFRRSHSDHTVIPKTNALLIEHQDATENTLTRRFLSRVVGRRVKNDLR